MKVWLAWTVDYEDAGVTGVYASREAAVAGTIADYPEPNKVRWSDDGETLTGDFYEFVMGLHAKHIARFVFEEHEVEGVPIVTSVTTGEAIDELLDAVGFPPRPSPAQPLPPHREQGQ